MTDKVQLIKEEIERIEKILDDFNKTHNNTIDNGIVSAKKNICKHIKSFIDSLPEEPVSEDLEEEILCRWEDDPHTSWPKCPYSDFKNIARHFAKWQKQQMNDALQTEYENGLYDMREEMMKDAVEAEVIVDRIGEVVYLCPHRSEKSGDKVKIIICKNE